ncbi:glycosyltransferase family 2 protein [Candidatus Sulfidibacterium hydrothermale]|uniref:glycosyltransferase family 2 protein n=1 Tax=Candidatus Sulfidibacterium hydrothermale TaxID=2875962 RepID=UPI001F0A78F6|nr:glycosyltransferase family 2 protein [Candidatus Sulfidibacterium hydrothermale]UBM63581.1 glycosyltransferase family 2 protein [Candidatus Sulfidibacterium hydrothermale]
MIQTKNIRPLVSVVTVNYNQSAVTCEFLDSFRKITYPATEVFVVDNASPNDHPEIIKEKFPEIHFIQTEKNLGFAGGNNAALPYCKGKYVLFINNDTEVPPGFLEPLVDVLEQNPEVAMVSPKIHYFHTPNTFQFAGFTPIHPITIRNFAIGFGEKDHGQYDITCETGSIFGAAMLVSMDAIRKVGMMTEVFFLYYEEHDWAEHMKKAGYKIYYQGKSLVLHKESISTVKESPFQIFYLTRGRLLYARRNNRGFTKLLSMLYLNLVAVPKQILHYIVQKRADLARASFKAMWWHMTHYRNIYGLPVLKEIKNDT